MNGIETGEDGRFSQGHSGNPAGRPKGAVTGRARMLGILDQLLCEEEVLAHLKAALEKEVLKRPVWFFINIVMPLLPRESKGTLDAGDCVVEWRGLLSVCGDAGPSDGTGHTDGQTGR